MSKESIYGGWSPDVIKKFKSWQLRTIVVSMIGYAIYYFLRKNFSVAMPGLTAQYGISNTSFGIIIGVSSLIYGFSRFANGFIVDRWSSRVIMALGLLLCAACNLAFGFGVNVSSWVTHRLQPVLPGHGLSSLRTHPALVDTPVRAGHQDVDMEHLALYRRRCRCLLLRPDYDQHG